jgi:hypothetical protein
MAERHVPAAADNDQSNQARSLAAAMGASLRRYWDERTGYQTFLYGAYPPTLHIDRRIHRVGSSFRPPASDAHTGVRQ